MTNKLSIFTHAHQNTARHVKICRQMSPLGTKICLMTFSAERCTQFPRSHMQLKENCKLC